jgi:hypothetical protein
MTSVTHIPKSHTITEIKQEIAKNSDGLLLKRTYTTNTKYLYAAMLFI